MRIVSVKPQKKHLNQILLEDGEQILLDRDTCSEYGLKPGREVQEQQLADLRYDSDYRRAKERALWYLDRADRTEKGLYRKLLEAGFEKHASAAVIARLAELGLLDDRRFAENFAARCEEANISERETVRKLLEKGVPYDLAKETAAKRETGEEEQIAILMEKKYARKLQEENGVRKVYAALARKGFSFGAIRNALQKYSEELENSEEW